MLVSYYVRLARRRGNNLLPGEAELRIDMEHRHHCRVGMPSPRLGCADKLSYEQSREALETHFTQVHKTMLEARRIIVKNDMHA